MGTPLPGLPDQRRSPVPTAGDTQACATLRSDYTTLQGGCEAGEKHLGPILNCQEVSGNNKPFRSVNGKQ